MTSPATTRDRRAIRRELAVTARWLRELRDHAERRGPALRVGTAPVRRVAA